MHPLFSYKTKETFRTTEYQIRYTVAVPSETNTRCDRTYWNFPNENRRFDSRNWFAKDIECWLENYTVSQWDDVTRCRVIAERKSTDTENNLRVEITWSQAFWFYTESLLLSRWRSRNKIKLGLEILAFCAANSFPIPPLVPWKSFPRFQLACLRLSCPLPTSTI